ncbi:MAG: hypothetical protein ABIS07_08190 [Dokdonella sp.]
MKMRSATVDAAAAIALLNHARSVCSHLDPLGPELTIEELRQRAEIVDSVIRARNKLRLMRDRAIAIEQALDRFKSRCANGSAFQQ